MEPFPSAGGHRRVDRLRTLFRSAVVGQPRRLPLAEGCLNAVNQQSLEQRLRAKGREIALSPRAIALACRSRSAEANRRAGSAVAWLSALVPLILILMTITGAVYPAIDLTAGERERGTLEMFVASPVPRMQLLFGKYAAVVTWPCSRPSSTWRR